MHQAYYKHMLASGVLLVLFTAAALLHVHARLQLVHLGYRVSEVAESNHKLQAERRRLEIEVATLSHPRRLRRLATQRLGLREPAPGQVLPALDAGGGKLAVRDSHRTRPGEP